MDRMWIRDILREADKCYIPDIPLRRRGWGGAHGSPELCTHNHKFTRWMQKKKWSNYCVHACGRCAEKTLIPACEIVTIPGSRCQMAPVLEGHDGWRERDGRRVNGGQNHKCGVSHGQTEKIYDWSGSTSAAWCRGLRMPGMVGEISLRL